MVTAALLTIVDSRNILKLINKELVHLRNEMLCSPQKSGVAPHVPMIMIINISEHSLSEPVNYLIWNHLQNAALKPKNKNKKAAAAKS